jgi:hypothetical protein
MEEWKNAPIKIGGRRVLASGSLINAAYDPVLFELPGFTLRLEFTSTPDSEERKVSYEGAENSFTLKLQNFNNPFGTAYSTPIGDIDGEPVHFSFFVHAIPSENVFRTISYTLAVGG